MTIDYSPQMSQVFARVLLIGAMLGLAAAVSPVTVLTALALACMMTLACRGLGSREKRLVALLLSAAILVRVALIIALFVFSEPGRLTNFPFSADEWLVKLRSLWIRNVWLGVPIDQLDFSNAFQDYGWTAYIYVIAYLQYLLGPAPYAVHLFNVSCFVAAALLLHRMVRASYGPIAATVALTLILFLPTQLLWSVSALKEPLYLLLLTLVLAGTRRTVRAGGMAERLGAAAVVLGSALALETIRVGGLFIVSSALTIALVGTLICRRVLVLALALLLLPVLSSRALEWSAVQSRIMVRVRAAATQHIGHVHTEGHSFRSLDQRFYSADPGTYTIPSMTWVEAQRFAVRSLISFIVVPLPWQAESSSELLFLPQQMVWYGLVLLAVVGVIRGVGGDVFGTWLFLGMACAGAAVIAPNSGNIGTMVRHRDGIVPFVACLSALGGVSVLSWAGLFRSGRPSAISAADWSPPAEPHLGRWWTDFVERTVQSSLVVRALSSAVRGSDLCAVFGDVLRPQIGYRDEALVEANRQTEDVLARIASSGLLMTGLLRTFRAISNAWRESVLAAAFDRFRGLEAEQRLRLVGLTLCVAALTAGLVAGAAEFVWPSVPATAAMAAAAGGVAVWAQRWVDAWHHSRWSRRVAPTT